MRRWHQERLICFKHWREHSHFAHDGGATGCANDHQIGRFRKSRGLGCGRARCQLCHFEKIHGVRSHYQRVADIRYLDQLNTDA
jgi:hypothetical protein